MSLFYCCGFIGYCCVVLLWLLSMGFCCCSCGLLLFGYGCFVVSFVAAVVVFFVGLFVVVFCFVVLFLCCCSCVVVVVL